MVRPTWGILSRDQARRVYDRLGAKQDQQSFYEDPIIDWFLQQNAFVSATRVFELGCGTGRLAHLLFQHQLSPTATYVGVDLSATMVGLACQKLAGFRDRAQVLESNGTPQIQLPDQSFDRFLSTYVFDLLAPTDIQMIVQEAHRILSPEGVICLAGITYGHTLGTKLVMTGWQGINRIWPQLLGGCRPMRIEPYLPMDQWQITGRTQVGVRGIASEALMARKR